LAHRQPSAGDAVSGMFKTPVLLLGSLALVWLIAAYANMGAWPHIAMAGIFVTLSVIGRISRRNNPFGTLD
jgi:hypothetical protein